MANWVQARAAQAVFLIIAFQVPLFRTPCRTGVCEAPLEVMIGQLGASFPWIPEDITKTVLYPGATTRRLIKAVHTRTPFHMPEWSSILTEFNMVNTTAQPADGEYRLEVMAGSYFVVGGAIQAMWKAGRMGVLGSMLIGWGLYKGGLFETPADASSPSIVQMYPMYAAVVILTFLTLRVDKDKVTKLTSAVKIGPKRLKQKLK